MMTPGPFVGKGANLFLVEDSPGLIVESHHHLYHEFDYIIRGRGEYSIGGRRIEVRAGDIIYIGRGIQHRRSSDISDPLLMCNLDIEDTMLKAPATKKLIWPLWRKWELSKAGDRKFICAVKTLNNLMPDEAGKAKSLNGRRWRKISDGLVSVLNGEWTMLAEISAGLHDLAMRIRLHPERDFQLGYEAGRMGVSRCWLSRRFHAVFGVTMLEYRDLARTDKAMGSLISGSTPVRRLWRELGYSSKPHFINTFRRFSGSAPGAFRKTYGGKNKLLEH